jgi:SsrA-binding protein
VQGQTLVALRLYWKNGRVKVELGIGRGKSIIDKRHDLKEKAVKRETDRTMAAFNRRHE